ncbi:MAG: hypothetical protein ACLSGF_09485 [Alistipes onderdonkii]
MPNEKITGNPAEKPAEKVSENGAEKPAGRCDGRRGRPQGGQQNRPQGEREGGRVGPLAEGTPQRPAGQPAGRVAVRPPCREFRPLRQLPPGGRDGGRKPAFNWTWRDYALQLSVVIIGIVVTFAGSGLISRWASQRQVRTVMQLVVSELEQNREMLRDVYSNLDYDRRGMLMFMEYDELEDIPADSLAHYSLLLSYLPSYRPQQGGARSAQVLGYRFGGGGQAVPGRYFRML